MQNNISFKIFDDEFTINMKCATVLAEKLIGEDEASLLHQIILQMQFIKKAVALSWMRRLMNLHTNDAGIKKDRNHFLKKLLEVMKQSVVQKFLSHPNTQHLTHVEIQKIKEEIIKVDETFKTPLLDELLTEDKESSSYMSMWSNDRRTYVAAKPIPGRGALVYMAVAEKPELGWTIPNQE